MRILVRIPRLVTVCIAERDVPAFRPLWRRVLWCWIFAAWAAGVWAIFALAKHLKEAL